MQTIHYKPDVTIKCSQPIVICRTDVDGVPAANTAVAIFAIDGKSIGDGCLISWQAKNSNDVDLSYAQIRMEITEPLAGVEQAKLVFSTQRGSGGLVQSFVINTDGSIESSFHRNGIGDPNTVGGTGIVAPIGCTYIRRDGGAGTSFYVKESNPTGGTGWVGK